LGSEASDTLVRVLYAGNGLWKTCLRDDCSRVNRDWGADALTYALYLRWVASRDVGLVPVFHALAATAPAHGACRRKRCTEWSDVPEWDAIAAMREYEVTGESQALTRAETAYAGVEGTAAYRGGACPEIRYQRPFGGGGGLKTLETDANAVKAALLLNASTGEPRYLDDAKARYAAIRRHFLDPAVALYTVYVFDDGKRCLQAARRFFASVNGDMIWNGLVLAEATGDASYRDESVATARAVDRHLSDARGIYANLQAENDVVEPLIEAMYELAVRLPRHGAFARAWLLRNAAAATGARRADGTYGRFFDGPPPAAPATAWQTNGGLALAIAAGALGRNDPPRKTNGWGKALAAPVSVVTEHLPASVAFTGSGIALIGTLGERCCEPGHAHVRLDGRETFDRTGIWQNKSSSGRSLPDSVLFAWRWPKSGRHVIELLPGERNAKEGDAFIHVQRTLVAP
jgi:hypothetical protein